MLSPTELMLSYQDFQDVKFSNSRRPVRRTTRQLYRLLATALCLHSEPLLAQLLRGCLAASLKFTLPHSLAAPTAAKESSISPRSEKATISALDLPVTLRHFPAGTGCCDAATFQASPLATGDLASRFGGTRCERMLESRLREIYFPRRCAQLLVDLQLRECLSTVIDKAVGRLFARLFDTANSEGTPFETSSSSDLAGSLISSEDQQLTQQRQTTGTGTAGAAALNTDGSNSFRLHMHQTHQQQHQQQHQHQHQQKQHQHQPTNRHQTHGDQAQPQQHPQQQPADSAASTTGSGSSQQRLCRLHASGSTRQTRAGESSCAVCAARHFLQQHLNRISGDPRNLAKLERTLRDCIQMQSHWCRSLQWIAANVKENRVPEFVRPLVNTWYSEDGCERSLTVNPQIIIKTDGHVGTWDIKKSDIV